MPFLSLEGIDKRFGQTQVLSGLSLEVGRGEFFGLLGPSGCGKTTSLRIIAGLESPNSGRVILEGYDITSTAPEKRGLGFVFQHYALFPHLDVLENVAFGLRARGLGNQEIKERSTNALDMVRLPDMARRRVSELSGGQQQRVAIARAIAFEPRLLLFDEPLSNLDVALREETRIELRELVTRLGLTAIYVTHDQDDAFALCDRIGVIGEGRILQTGAPHEIYDRPSVSSVARFLGRNNLISAVRLSSMKNSDGQFETLVGGHRLNVPVSKSELGPLNRPATLAIRPEHVEMLKGDNGALPNALRGTVRDLRFAGETLHAKIDASGLIVEALLFGRREFEQGESCTVRLPPEHIRVLSS
jgi:ABC-type Fe3+/spermidine/putrescine transport system ATPase subunit